MTEIMRRTVHVLLYIALVVSLCWARSTPQNTLKASPEFECSDQSVEHPPMRHSLDDIAFVNLDEPFLTGKKVAVIVEDRPLPNLVPLILHFSSVLGSEWPIVLFTTDNFVTDSTPLFRAINEGRVFVKKLPFEVKASDPNSISAFLTKPWIWNQLAPTDHVLLFQSNSIICGNSPMMVEDFMQYSFISAPVNYHQQGQDYNGGLSLRDRNLMLEIIEASEGEKGMGCGIHFEDQWFYQKLAMLVPNEDGTPRAKLPDIEIAKRFAVKGIGYEWPLGYSQAQSYQYDNLMQIQRWCPEIWLSNWE